MVHLGKDHVCDHLCRDLLWKGRHRPFRWWHPVRWTDPPRAFHQLFPRYLGVAFLYYWPTLLALVSRTAPPAVKSTMMGFVFLTLFLSNTIIGRLGALYELMTPLNFWAMHAAIAALGGTLALIVNRPLSRLFQS